MAESLCETCYGNGKVLKVEVSGGRLWLMDTLIDCEDCGGTGQITVPEVGHA